MMEPDRQQRINEYILRDSFARLLGATAKIPAPGSSRVTLTVTPDMTNFHGITHGQTAAALNVTINFLCVTKPVQGLI